MGSGAARELALRVPPLTYVRKQAPPILTVHGTANPSVPHAHAVKLTEALNAAAPGQRWSPLRAAAPDSRRHKQTNLLTICMAVSEQDRSAQGARYGVGGALRSSILFSTKAMRLRGGTLTRRIKMKVPLLACTALIMLPSAALGRTIVVNQKNARAADRNPGTEAQPLDHQRRRGTRAVR